MEDFITMMKVSRAKPTQPQGVESWTNRTPHQILYSYTYIYAMAVGMTKVSILLFYYRIFGFQGTLWKTCLCVGAALAVSYPLIVWITMANCCQPVSLFWNRFLGAEGDCIDINTFFLALGIINMLVDIIVLLIPIPQIIALNMNPRKKLGVCGIFLLGSL